MLINHHDIDSKTYGHMVTYSGGTPMKSILTNWKFYRKKPFVA